MKTLGLCLAVLAAAATLTTVAAGGPAAKKQRVAITMKLHESTFVLNPIQQGAVTLDWGTLTDNAPNAQCREVIRDGQGVNVCNGSRWTLTARRGTLTIRTPQEWVDPGSGGCGVAFGTWKVIRATGEYTGITGGGRSAYDAHCKKWYARHEGFLTLP
jgi:hypothetical protein